MLLTYRQVYHEAAAILYAVNVFSIDSGLEKHLQISCAVSGHLIQKIELVYRRSINYCNEMVYAWSYLLSDAQILEKKFPKLISIPIKI